MKRAVLGQDSCHRSALLLVQMPLLLEISFIDASFLSKKQAYTLFNVIGNGEEGYCRLVLNCF